MFRFKYLRYKPAHTGRVWSRFVGRLAVERMKTTAWRWHYPPYPRILLLVSIINRIIYLIADQGTRDRERNTASSGKFRVKMSAAKERNTCTSYVSICAKLCKVPTWSGGLWATWMCISAEFSTEFFYEMILADRNNLHQVYPIRAVKSKKEPGLLTYKVIAPLNWVLQVDVILPSVFTVRNESWGNVLYAKTMAHNCGERPFSAPVCLIKLSINDSNALITSL